MPRTTRNYEQRRRAATAAMVLIMLPVTMGFGALTIDMGRLANTRAELQNAADAAALAAAQDLGGLDPMGSIQKAMVTAKKFISLNPVWNSQPISDYEIDFGESRLNKEGTAVTYTVGVIPANSVRVTVRYNLQYTFGQVFGLKSNNVTASATAGIGARDFIIAIDASGSMTKQSVEADVCADLDALGIPYPPPVVAIKGKKGGKAGKGPCVTTAKSLTYDGSMGGSEFWGIFTVGDVFMPPSVRILPMKSAKDAASFGVDTVQNAGYDDQLGTVGFGPGAPWAQQLSTDYDTVRAKLRGLNAYAGSDIDLGILAARAELLSVRARNGVDKVIVVFADGQSDVALALAAAQTAADDGITIHVVGLGTGVDQVLLDGIASIGGGTAQYILNNTDEAIYGPQLKNAFQSIATNEVKYGLIE